jgi:hypothetical protein
VTEWQTLPTGIYFWPGMFTYPPTPMTIYTTNTFNGSINSDVVYPLSTNQFPFPNITAATSWYLPYIAFTPQGTLAGNEDQYIVLARGSIFYEGGVPNIAETPPGNETNNPCMIKIDWATARGTIVQNQFQ